MDISRIVVAIGLAVAVVVGVPVTFAWHPPAPVWVGAAVLAAYLAAKACDLLEGRAYRLAVERADARERHARAHAARLADFERADS